MSEYKYQSSIEMIQGEMGAYMDGEILKAVQNVGINVDKDELLKALAYDRDQYNKGFHDAEPEVGRWEEIHIFSIAEATTIDMLQSTYCPKCHRYHTTPYFYSYNHYDYCPNCGGKD